MCTSILYIAKIKLKNNMIWNIWNIQIYVQYRSLISYDPCDFFDFFFKCIFTDDTWANEIKEPYSNHTSSMVHLTPGRPCTNEHVRFPTLLWTSNDCNIYSCPCKKYTFIFSFRLYIKYFYSKNIWRQNRCLFGAVFFEWNFLWNFYFQ